MVFFLKNKLTVVFSLLILSFFLLTFSNASYNQYAQEEHIINNKHVRLYPLFSLEYGDSEEPEICKTITLGQSCGRNQLCKSNKGRCGEILSGKFFNNTMPDWIQLDAQYSTNNGIDGLFKTFSPNVRYVVIEDKTDTATLSQDQMSLRWQYDRMLHLRCGLYSNYGQEECSSIKRIPRKFSGQDYPTLEECNEFLTCLPNGKVIGFHTLTTSIDNRMINTYNYRYTYNIDISLLGHPSWSQNFKNNYINNYQKDIHNSFKNNISNFTFKNLKNFNVFSSFNYSNITFN